MVSGREQFVRRYTYNSGLRDSVGNTHCLIEKRMCVPTTINALEESSKLFLSVSLVKDYPN